jgi:hypothetical protein
MDKAMELENIDWVSTAKRPQDTPLSIGGMSSHLLNNS